MTTNGETWSEKEKEIKIVKAIVAIIISRVSRFGANAQ